MLVPLLCLLTTAPGVLPKPQPGDEHIKPPKNPTERVARQEAVAPVASVDEHELVLSRPGKPLKIKITEATRVFAGGQVASLADVRPGRQVRVSYDAIGGPARANWIEVLPAPEAAPGRTP